MAIKEKALSLGVLANPVKIYNLLDILATLKKVVEEDFDIKSIGKTLEIARDNIKREVLHANFLWDMSK